MTDHSVSGPVSPDCTTPDTGEPAGTEQGQPYFDWDTADPTWSKWRMCRSGFGGNPWVIIPRDFTENPAYSGFFRDFGDLSFLATSGIGFWLTSTDAVVNSYAPQAPATGTATVAEYVPPVAAVVTNILLGSTPEACSILNSRIVRGPL